MATHGLPFNYRAAGTPSSEGLPTTISVPSAQRKRPRPDSPDEQSHTCSHSKAVDIDAPSDHSHVRRSENAATTIMSTLLPKVPDASSAKPSREQMTLIARESLGALDKNIGWYGPGMRGSHATCKLNAFLQENDYRRTGCFPFASSAAQRRILPLGTAQYVNVFSILRRGNWYIVCDEIVVETRPKKDNDFCGASRQLIPLEEAVGNLFLSHTWRSRLDDKPIDPEIKGPAISIPETEMRRCGVTIFNMLNCSPAFTIDPRILKARYEEYFHGSTGPPST